MDDEEEAVSRETSRERHPGRVRSQPSEVEKDQAAQAELDELWVKRRAEDTAKLVENEAANYARTHAIIERDEDGNPIETEPKE